jgi:hypothetical protein
VENNNQSKGWIDWSRLREFWEWLSTEARWFLKTLATTAVVIAVGRVIKYLTKGGIDIEAILKGGWHAQIDEALKRRDDDEDD